MKHNEAEARARWGKTAAYREYKEKTKSYIEEKYEAVNVGMKQIFDAIYACRQKGTCVTSDDAQALVAQLQAHITANYYACTNEILAGLGRMYVGDECVRRHLDQSGEGTAEFTAEAIAYFCRQK